MSLTEALTTAQIQDSPVFRIREVCILLGITRMTVWRWITQGHLQAVKINGRTRWVTRDSIAALTEA